MVLHNSKRVGSHRFSESPLIERFEGILCIYTFATLFPSEKEPPRAGSTFGIILLFFSLLLRIFTDERFCYQMDFCNFGRNLIEN